MLDVPSGSQADDMVIPVPIRVELSDVWIGQIPQVFLAERPKWLQTGLDWHVLENKWVCYELPNRWQDHLIGLLKTGARNIDELAAQWVIRATAHVLHVNYVCHRTGRKSWPTAIPFWQHGDAGPRQYLSENGSWKKRTKEKTT